MKLLSNILSIAILFSIVASTFFVQRKLDDIRDIVKESQIPKLEIVNNSQFSKVCSQFSKQWGANGYVFYLLQPKSSSKTHKEKASASIMYDRLPVRVELTDTTHKKQLITYKFLIGDQQLASELLHTEDIKCNQFLLIPIYQNDIIIGELYLFYDGSIPDDSIMNKVTEAQLLGKLLN